MSGAGLLRGLVVQLFLEDVAVEDRGGALHLNALRPEDLEDALRRHLVTELGVQLA